MYYGEGVSREFMCSNIVYMIIYIYPLLTRTCIEYYVVLTYSSINRKIHHCLNTWAQLDLFPQPSAHSSRSFLNATSQYCTCHA